VKNDGATDSGMLEDTKRVIIIIIIIGWLGSSKLPSYDKDIILLLLLLLLLVWYLQAFLNR
jgi:hypothetical protein